MDLLIVRTGSHLFSLFGALALLVAAVVLYGVRAYGVVERTREIGIRMALEAGAYDTPLTILREGLAITAIGACDGLALSLALGRVLAGRLYQVSASDTLSS